MVEFCFIAGKFMMDGPSASYLGPARGNDPYFRASMNGCCSQLHSSDLSSFPRGFVLGPRKE